MVAAVVLALVAAFQLALAAGAPWGRAAYGGAHERLPARLRMTSAVAVGFWVLAALVVVRRSGVKAWAPLPDAWLPAAVWVLVALLAVSVVMNSITHSRVERTIWVPVTSVALVATLTVAMLGPDLGPAA